MKSHDFLNENIVDDAATMHQDHEVQMARKECYHSAENAIKIHQLLQQVSEAQGLEGWVAAKITLASDYLTTVREYLEYQQISGGQQASLNVVTVAEGQLDEKRAARKQGVSEAYEEYDDEDDEDEQTDGFYVVIANEDDGVFIGALQKDGGRWRETTVSGNPPYNWGGGYMSYLTPDEVMQWIRKDYNRSYEVAGPFYDDADVQDYADSLMEMSAGSVAGVVNANGMGKKKAEIGSLFGGTYKSKKAKK